ncbi:1-acyl-sn-glycerol-3-phosphate acyltransferase [Dysgonomonas sp. Marseille-P4677]|uniref:lysophospholipid acyltransferase family protein n=1 Tax=Dysgonomonas sp. Marseille-P4677 TaxID=2364790 RepID=UPI001911854E|nr:lysophospholipid acyltransferase family protein [Dysgonomonas sp. Marseille-P4677]MBK5722543.1 1-acyl-sn-glycerol-3-phosphate acyltransferase [Dysgonomonas sp. Marseille-P4677]
MKKVVYLVYQWVIFVPLLILATIWCTLTIIIGSTLGNNKFWGYYPGVIWGRFVCAAALLRIKVKRNPLLDKKQSYVFVANHQGAFDIFLVYGYLGHNFKWLMKQALRKMPLVGFASKKAGHVFVDQSSRKGIVETMRQTRDTLRDGMSTVVFPEGHRTPDGKMAEFKKGAFQTALSLKLPIVPVTIDGAYKVLPIHSWTMYPAAISLTFHDPIPTEGITSDDLPKLIADVHKIIESGLKDSE